MFVTGEFKADNQDFGQKSVGQRTKLMYDGSVRPLIKHRDRMEALVDAAWEHAPYIRDEDGDGNFGRHGVHAGDSDADVYMAADPSSPPPEE